MALKLYKKKRNFAKTPEPKGVVNKSYKNLYIIQKHAASHLHYDLRLELNGVLLSWAVPKGPCLDPTVKRLAMHVEDHPVEYGTFQGIIPKGEYGGGTVMLWDKGCWESEDENPSKAYHKGHLRFILKGEKLKGKYSLIKFGKEDKSWFLVKGKDKYAKPLSQYDITVKKPNSVLNKQTMNQITASFDKVWTKKGLKKISKKKLLNKNHLKPAKFPKKIFPELATLIDQPPTGNQWVHEIKLDGYRIIAFKQGNFIRLMSRNSREWTKYFPNVVAELSKLPIQNIILDGEMALLDKNDKTNFQLLQNSIMENANKPFIYFIFDILYLDQFNLMDLPLIERKSILHKIIPSTKKTILRYNDHITGDGHKIFQKACELGLEGIVSKEVHSPYLERRTKSWLKTKCINRQEFVIGGYSNPKGSRGYFGSLFLGVYNKKKQFVFCGNVGTGFTASSLKKIYQQLQKYKTSKNPFNSNPPGVTTANWVKPVLVAEVEFSEWTSEGILRHPSFQALRTDKPAKEIIREKPKN